MTSLNQTPSRDVAVESHSSLPSSPSPYVSITFLLRPFYDIFITPITLTSPPTSELVRLLHAHSVEVERLLDDPSSSLIFLHHFLNRSIDISTAVMDRAKAGMSHDFDEDEPAWTGTSEAWERREDKAEDRVVAAYARALAANERGILLINSKPEQYILEQEIEKPYGEVEYKKMKERTAKVREEIELSKALHEENLRTIAFLDGRYLADVARNRENGWEY